MNNRHTTHILGMLYAVLLSISMPYAVLYGATPSLDPKKIPSEIIEMVVDGGFHDAVIGMKYGYGEHSDDSSIKELIVDTAPRFGFTSTDTALSPEWWTAYLKHAQGLDDQLVERGITSFNRNAESIVAFLTDTISRSMSAPPAHLPPADPDDDSVFSIPVSTSGWSSASNPRGKVPGRPGPEGPGSVQSVRSRHYPSEYAGYREEGPSYGHAYQDPGVETILSSICRGEEDSGALVLYGAARDRYPTTPRYM